MIFKGFRCHVELHVYEIMVVPGSTICEVNWQTRFRNACWGVSLFEVPGEIPDNQTGRATIQERHMIVLITFEDTDEKTGKPVRRVSHGVDSITGKNIVMSDVNLSELAGVKYHEGMREYYLDEASPREQLPINYRGVEQKAPVRRVKDAEMVFCFGSNLAGRHGKGAAQFAMRNHGAKYGMGEGRTGMAYALPTKNEHLEVLPLSVIEKYVEEYLLYTEAHPDEIFYTTKFGTGLASYKDTEIAPMLRGAGPNVLLPGAWMNILDPGHIHLAAVGSRDFNHYEFFKHHMDSAIANLKKKFEKVTLVSGGAKGTDAMAERYYKESGSKIPGVSMTVVEANWGKYSKSAGPKRNRTMVGLSTHVIAFWDMASPGTSNMISTSREEGLIVKVVDTRLAPDFAASHGTYGEEIQDKKTGSLETGGSVETPAPAVTVERGRKLFVNTAYAQPPALNIKPKASGPKLS